MQLFTAGGGEGQNPAAPVTIHRSNGKVFRQVNKPGQVRGSREHSYTHPLPYLHKPVDTETSLASDLHYINTQK